MSLFHAFRESFAEAYGRKQFLSDLQAGLAVGVVAIPLGMALAIASGVPPQYGLYTVVVAGAIVAILGGSRFQITGPTAAFVVLLLPIVQRHGIAGLLVAGFIAGLIQFCLGLSGLGQIIRYVPNPVTTGFTSGIALVIASLQIKDFLGLKFHKISSSFFEEIQNIFQNIGSFQMKESLMALFTLSCIGLCLKYLKKTPAPIVALSVAGLITCLIHQLFPDIQIETIYSRFSYEQNGEWIQGIPDDPPRWVWPWLVGTQKFELSLANLREILPSAFAIAALGAIESLLSAVVADGMTEKKHDPNAELIALGIGNMICPFFGGIPATGAIARTTTNIRFGAYSPIAACIHSLTALLAIVFFGSLISYIPMASLAALLLFVAWNMSERELFLNILKNSAWEDRTVLLVCFGLTVIFDMTIGVGVGVVLAALLFIRRMAAWTQTQHILEPANAEGIKERLSSEIFYYRISGPLFFGAAHQAVEAITSVSNNVKVVILDLTQVNLIDSTGMTSLDSSIKKLLKRNLSVYIAASNSEIQRTIQRLNSVRQHPERALGFKDPKDALARAQSIISADQAASNA